MNKKSILNVVIYIWHDCCIAPFILEMLASLTEKYIIELCYFSLCTLAQPDSSEWFYK